jgi:undecaprenyl-diphosphatase
MMHAKNKYLLVITSVFVVVLLLLLIDFRILVFVQQFITPELKSVGKILSNKGLFLLYGIFLLLFIYALIKKNKQLKKIFLVYLKVQILFSFALVRIMKIVLGRARPKIGSEFTFFSLEADYNSFPSGHSADAFVSGIFLFYLLKNSKYSAYRYLPLLYAATIALSRIAVNAHYPSDVIAGAAIGIFGAWFYLNRFSKQADQCF